MHIIETKKRFSNHWIAEGNPSETSSKARFGNVIAREKYLW